VIVGSRYITGGGTINWNIWRQIISRFGSFYARLILRMKINDFTGGFNAWNRKALSTIGIDSIFCEGYSFQIELKYRAKLAGLRILEVPIIFEERRAGASKMSGGIVVEAMYKIWFLAMKRRTILKSIHSK
jgi:dolichol-phosphate mannosyltransferase